MVKSWFFSSFLYWSIFLWTIAEERDNFFKKNCLQLFSLINEIQRIKQYKKLRICKNELFKPIVNESYFSLFVYNSLLSTKRKRETDNIFGILLTIKINWLSKKIFYHQWKVLYKTININFYVIKNTSNKRNKNVI